jgi:hypothetical protein
MRKEVSYLRHIITDQGVHPNPQKVKSVLEFSVPSNTKQIKSFLGLSEYYRRFIQNYGSITKLLTTLLKKDIPFIWSDLYQESFEKLKAVLTEEPLLQYPDFNKPFNITYDASNYTIGCVLSQGKIGKDLPFIYTFADNYVCIADSQSCRTELQYYRKRIICYCMGTKTV